MANCQIRKSAGLFVILEYFLNFFKISYFSSKNQILPKHAKVKDQFPLTLAHSLPPPCGSLLRDRQLDFEKFGLKLYNHHASLIIASTLNIHSWSTALFVVVVHQKQKLSTTGSSWNLHHDITPTHTHAPNTDVRADGEKSWAASTWKWRRHRMLCSGPDGCVCVCVGGISRPDAKWFVMVSDSAKWGEWRATMTCF